MEETERSSASKVLEGGTDKDERRLVVCELMSVEALPILGALV